MTWTVPATVGCDAHRAHVPAPTYLELHHPVPQAWQKAWMPPGESKTLWDPRTIPLCRTGHGNVHYWLVFMMKRWDGKIPKISQNEHKFVRKEMAIAQLAIERWIEVGGSIEFLVDRKLWGQI